MTTSSPPPALVAVDLSTMRAGRAPGGQRFVAELLPRVAGGCRERDVEVVVLGNTSTEGFLPAADGLRLKVIGDPPRSTPAHLLMKLRVRWLRGLARERASIVYWSPLNQSLYPRFGPELLTVHDLSPVHYLANRDRYGLSAAERWHYRLKVYRLLDSISAAEQIVADSEATADQIRRAAPQAAVSVIHCGLSELPPAATDEPGDHVLAVGIRGRHKDAPLIATVAQRTRLPFVVIGAEHADYPVNVTVVGRCSDEELADLYANARVVLCPSRYEGFGFPPLEAASFGTPVVASDIPTHREVAGTHATYFAVGDPDAAAKQLEKVYAAEQAGAREPRPALREEYSWDAAAARYTKVLLSMAQRAGRA